MHTITSHFVTFKFGQSMDMRNQTLSCDVDKTISKKRAQTVILLIKFLTDRYQARGKMAKFIEFLFLLFISRLFS